MNREGSSGSPLPNRGNQGGASNTPASATDDAVLFRTSDIKHTQSAQANSYFTPESPKPSKTTKAPKPKTEKTNPLKRFWLWLLAKRQRLIVAIVGAVLVIILLVLSVILVVGTLNGDSSENADSATTEITEELVLTEARILTDAELENLYVDDEIEAESVIMTYEEKLAQATSDEERVTLLVYAVMKLTMYAADTSDTELQAYVLDLAYQAEDINQGSNTASLIVSTAELFDNQTVYEEWYQIMVERYPEATEGAG